MICTRFRVLASHQEPDGSWVIDDVEVLDVSLGCTDHHDNPTPEAGSIICVPGELSS